MVVPREGKSKDRWEMSWGKVESDFPTGVSQVAIAWAQAHTHAHTHRFMRK